MKKIKNAKEARRTRVKKGIRKRVFGTSERPRLTVFRSNMAIYAQIIDDTNGVTICGCSSFLKDIQGQKITKMEKSVLVGKQIAQLAASKGITKVVFDRNGFAYHGRIKSLAEGAREGGLSF